MKILLIITKAEVGGAQNFIIDLARDIKNNNHEVVVGVGESGYLTNYFKENGVETVLFKNLKRTKNPLKNIFYISEIKNFLNKHNFDIVHFNSSNTLFGAIGAKLTKNKPKTIFTYHGLSVLDTNYKINYFAKKAYVYFFKIMMNYIDASVFVCRKNMETVKKIGIQTKSFVIYNGVNKDNLEFYSKEIAREKLEDTLKKDFRNSFLIGSIGRLSYPKNYEFLISVFPELIKISNKIKLVIIGDGEKRAFYQELIDKNKLTKNIFLLGSLDRAYKLIPAFDVFTLPSRYEGMSITLIEALFARLPIIASNVGGNKETIPVPDEQIYDLDSKKDFLEKFRNIYNSQSLRNDLVERNTQHSKNYSTKIMTEKYINLYKNISSR